VHRFEAAAGRLDAVVAGKLGVPRAEAQRAIAEGRVRVDGRAREKAFRLAGGESVEVDVPAGPGISPEGPAVPVVYRDEHLLIVDKPPGMPTHPTENRRAGTLVNRLLGMGVPLSSLGGPLRPGIVHRLDAGTSGLILVACDDAAHGALAEMLRRHEIDRRYLALVRGVVEHDRFAVEAPLGRSGPRVRVDVTGGRPADTAFDVLDRFHRSTLLAAMPRTGRTHQIRVHLSAVGHAILGDKRYGGGGADASALGLERPFLHSYRIEFDHPMTKERIERESPLPPDLRSALDRARAERTD
jgi:23S rRNA pseudouridine1911/1915/1917 synthase